ncbi:hypothetical protein VTL71DRAFT_1956 [Oculimacula yallundae]|uniref:Zn(2)-C6 fungal-type domain-containing protein n=1 Tax=Oculimacula yallundae TaxID=86028 RepID=A0ABR4CE43_9HELO
MQPLRHRKKTSLACNQCRDRKTRCNGDRPVCKFCRERQLQCQYENGLSKDSSSPAGIERRLRKLEQLSPRRDRSAGRDETPQPRFPHLRPETPNENSGARAGANQGLSKHGSPRKPFYGSSSSESFLDQVSSIAHALSQQQRWLGHTPFPCSESVTFPSQLGISSMRSGFLTEPDLALTQIECFWDNIHPIFPLLHRPSFLQAYKLFFQSQETETGNNAQDCNVFHAILNIVFALSIQNDSQLPIEQRLTTADIFYRKSSSLVPLGTIDHPTQSHVQLFLLTAIYLHSTPYANRCWDMVGTGIRTAVGLSLYRENSSLHSQESQLDRETRRRIWFCCVVLDKMSAATFGRPATLTGSRKVILPQVIDDEFLQCVGEGSQPPGLPSYTEGFVYSLGLFEILADVLAVDYTSSRSQDDHDSGSQTNQGRNCEHILTNTISLNSRLDDLVERIPNHLRESRSSSSTLAQSRRRSHVQSQTLECRIHYVRLLILRPWLLEGIYSAIPSSLDQNTLQEIRRTCISTAQQTIYQIYNSEQNRPQNPTWHAVYFLHAAASILLVAALHPKDYGGIDLTSEPYQSSWQSAIQILRSNKVQLQACEHVVEKLESCREEIRELEISRAAENLSMPNAADSLGVSFLDPSFDWDLDCLSTDFFLDPKSVD